VLSDQNYSKILNFFDKHFWEGKTTESNWHYYGLVLDWYFDSSVLCIDYLDVADFFDENGGFTFVDHVCLSEQYKNLPVMKRLKILQNVMNVLKHSTINKEQSNHMIELVSKVLKRDNVKVINPEIGYMILLPDDILDSGSYCNIVRVKEGVLRKELLPVYKNDDKLKKRLKYEFENMQKLKECPQILNVYNYDPENSSYLMEQGDKNLFRHLNDELELSFEDKLKIILDLLKGMAFAHKQSIIHRDLHLGNILKIGKDFVICDFGLSKDLSIERSMKSSNTEKNNHLFVDPLANFDFTKLDLKSDIYSIGKIIDYVFTYNESNLNHIFTTVVERCISRDKEHRYDSVNDIISDINGILKNKSKEANRKNVINKILNNLYDAQVHEFVMDLIETNKISKFIVAHKLSSFGKVIVKFESVYQREMLQAISHGYREATGYGGWSNYDIFAQIAYYLCTSLKDLEAQNIARSILGECANIRYTAKGLLERLPD
jgi:eukaryotic-like serine/threonine-protein kinase